MNRFFVYEEYGAKYEMMIRDVASAHRTIPEWDTYQKGLEALASSLGAVGHHLDHSRKSLTIGDLLVKVNKKTLIRFPDSGLTLSAAYSKDLQVSPAFCGTPEIYPSL